MINSIQSSGNVVVAQDGPANVGRAVPESSPVHDADQDAFWPGQKSTDSKSTNSDSVEIQGLYGVLRTSKDAVNRVATEIRGLGEAKSLVARVRDSLDLIVKSFPPFPPGSLEREQFLNSVAGIRAMIERLSFPPAQSEAISRTFSSDAFVDAGASDQALSAGLDHVGALEDSLGIAQGKLGDAIQLGNINNRTEDAFFIEQSHGLGQALLAGKFSIGQESQLVRGMLN